MKTNTCDTTVAGIAGSYQLVKLISFKNTDTLDLTPISTSCYTFNASGTANYVQSTNCNGSNGGTWNVFNGIFSFSLMGGDNTTIFNSALTLITIWDCTNLVLTTDYPSATNYRYTFKKH